MRFNVGDRVIVRSPFPPFDSRGVIDKIDLTDKSPYHVTYDNGGNEWVKDFMMKKGDK